MLEDEDIHRAVNYIPRVTSSNVQKVETKNTRQYTLEEERGSYQSPSPSATDSRFIDLYVLEDRVQ
jgi:hypothetical protein